MPSRGYLFERFNFLTIGAWAFYQAMWSTNLYYHLTYWTLMVHVIYFTVDKSSPNSRAAAQVMQGMSFCGAFAVMLAYSFMCVFGSLHWGSWLDWENALGAYMGTISTPRSLPALGGQKFFEHYWPPIALLIDAHLSRAELAQIYSGWTRRRGFAVGMGAYFAYVSVWENTCTGFSKGDAVTIYQQPPYLRTAHVLSKFGLPVPNGLAEDLFFLSFQKAWVIGVTLIVWLRFIGPIFQERRSSPSSGTSEAKKAKAT